MPTPVTHTVTCQIPTAAEFAARFPRYAAFAAGAGRFLFDLLMTPPSFVAAEVATVDLGRPAISGVARRIREAVRLVPAAARPRKWGALKQFCGAVVCALMEANGFRKTGTKRAVGVRGFNRGEFYQSRRTTAPAPRS